jgi:hypothetical protein
VPKERSAGSERRLHVRVRPAPDYDVLASLSDDGIVWLALQVVDLSVGGLGLLVSEDLATKRVGDALKLRLTFGDAEPFEVAAVIRHIGQREYGMCGMEFQAPADDVASGIRTAVGELLERGHLA